MPRKQIPADHFSRAYTDTLHKLSDSAKKRLAIALKDKDKEIHTNFLPIAERIIGRYKSRVKIYETQPKLGQIRASLKELSKYAVGLSHGIESLDGDTYQFVHEVLSVESGSEPNLLNFENLDLDKLEDIDIIKELFCSDLEARWNDVQELMEKVEGEMLWLTEVVDHSLSLVEKNSKSGPQPKPLLWLAEQTIAGLQRVNVNKPLTKTRDGVISEVMRILLEESGAEEHFYLERDLLPEISKALKNTN